MSQIFTVFITKRWTEAWYALSETERNQLIDKVNQALEQVSGKRLISCDSSWSSAEWAHFGVEVFPDMEAAQKYGKMLGDLNWGRYHESISVMGTEIATG